jgi:hypothetical protein
LIPDADQGQAPQWPGIDIRADHGWVVGPGSRSTWGELKWVRGGYTTPTALPEGMAAQLHKSALHGRRAFSAETVDFIESSPETSTLPALLALEERLDLFK